jgi:hypothetical protein
MATSSDPRIEDIRRIAFVTRRFHDLQGLRTVADAVPPVIFAALLRSGESNRNVIILACGLAAYFAARATWIRSRLDAYYSRRLGRVDRSVPNPDRTLLFSPSRPLGWGDRNPNQDWIFLIYQGLISAPMGRDMHLPVFVQVLLTMLMLGFPPIWILVRDWPHRAHWLLPLGVGVAFALRLGVVATSQEAVAWQVLVCLGCGVALAIVGALDHLLLVKSLGGGAGARSTAEYADIH